MALRSVEDALREIMDAVSPLAPETAAVETGLGRFLAEDLVATTDSPAFSNSAMDGYAVRATEAVGTLPVLGESRAGGPPPPPLAPGTAMRIFTGAPMPEGADAVVIQENTTREGDVVRVNLTPRPGDNVRLRASDVAQGAPLLRRGARLGPAEIALLASQRIADVAVHRAPRVAVICTGDELRSLRDPAEPGTIVNSNAYLLQALLTECGAIPWPLPPANDDVAEITARLRDALAADLVLTVGGVSVGEYDLVHRAFDELGIERRVWKVAMKPGKPLAFATHQGTPILGLPGNPVSAHIAFEVFARPALRRMMGDPSPYPRALWLPLTAAHDRSTGRMELARAAVVERDNGGLAVALQRHQGSGSLTSTVGADALVLFAANQAHVDAGQMVLTIPFGHPWRSGRARVFPDGGPPNPEK